MKRRGKEELPKELDLNEINRNFILFIENKRNNIPEKSVNCPTSLELFMSYVDEAICLA
ncbi:MAG: hypothetical protein WBF61_03500 [Carnobacterium sp.]